jgi:hypothetical protein
VKLYRNHRSVSSWNKDPSEISFTFAASLVLLRTTESTSCLRAEEPAQQHACASSTFQRNRTLALSEEKVAQGLSLSTCWVQCSVLIAFR